MIEILIKKKNKNNIKNKKNEKKIYIIINMKQVCCR